MDFKKKLKTRLFIAIIYTVLGLIMVGGAFISKTENNFISSLGIVFAIIGIIRIIQYFITTGSEEKIRKQRIAETDERNLSIVNKARSIAFTIYSLLSACVIIILSLLNYREAAQITAYSLCALIVIYLISYWILMRKS